MSLELAYLVTTRAAVKGDPYRMLLQASLLANAEDAYSASDARLGEMARLPPRRAKRAVAALRKHGLLITLKVSKTTPGATYVAREVLMSSPMLDQDDSEFAGTDTGALKKAIADTLKARVAARSQLLAEWMQMPQNERKAFVAELADKSRRP